MAALWRDGWQLHGIVNYETNRGCRTTLISLLYQKKKVQILCGKVNPSVQLHVVGNARSLIGGCGSGGTSVVYQKSGFLSLTASQRSNPLSVTLHPHCRYFETSFASKKDFRSHIFKCDAILRGIAWETASPSWFTYFLLGKIGGSKHAGLRSALDRRTHVNFSATHSQFDMRQLAFTFLGSRAIFLVGQ